MKRYTLIAVWVMSSFLCVSTAAQSGGLKYSLKDLGTFGGTYSDALAINDSGQVVGYYATGSQINCFYYQNSRILATSTWKSPYPNGLCTPYSINSSGVFAGTIAMSTGDYSAFTGTRNLKGQVSLTYLSSTWGRSTYGYSISDGGGVAGWAADINGNFRAAYWNDGCIPGYTEMAGTVSWGTVALDPSGDQWCYASYAALSIANLSTGQRRAYSFYSFNGITDEFLPLSNTFVNSWVYASDKFQNFVGYSEANDGEWHATLWNTYNYPFYPVDLGAPGAISWATGISLASPDATYDWIIGQWQGGSVPFLRVSTSTCTVQINLQNLLDSSGTGWTLVQANAINVNDQIVGAATFNGVQHAVLLSPNGLPIC